MQTKLPKSTIKTVEHYFIISGLKDRHLTYVPIGRRPYEKRKESWQSLTLLQGFFDLEYFD